MVNFDKIAFKIKLVDEPIKRGVRTAWKYLSDTEDVKVPKPGEKFPLGNRDYIVVSRIMPLVEDWRRYGVPPTVWAREAR